MKKGPLSSTRDFLNLVSRSSRFPSFAGFQLSLVSHQGFPSGFPVMETIQTETSNLELALNVSCDEVGMQIAVAPASLPEIPGKLGPPQKKQAQEALKGTRSLAEGVLRTQRKLMEAASFLPGSERFSWDLVLLHAYSRCFLCREVQGGSTLQMSVSFVEGTPLLESKRNTEAIVFVQADPNQEDKDETIAGFPRVEAGWEVSFCCFFGGGWYTLRKA